MPTGLPKIGRNIMGPVAGVSRYIFPIPAEAITNSQGKLANDGYGF
jgi:hypothetical protein